MIFHNAAAKTYSTGDLFLGLDETGREIGMMTDRHAITIAGSRSGKGAALIIPSLRRWPDNALVIDPKGENVAHTWEDRQRLGQAVYVLDPFEAEDVPPQLRVAFNPLDLVDPDGLSAAEDIEAIADGLVKRSDPKYAQWDNGAVALLAGVIAYVMTIANDESRNLTTVFQILQQPDEKLAEDAAEMVTLDDFDGLITAAGNTIQTAFNGDKTMDAAFLSDARNHSKWLGRKSMRNVLGASSFDLRELKNGAASVFLVLPPEYLETHAVFMRLFVRTALNVMAKGGSGRGKKCLFILDEFAALGKITAISTACGLMPSYGVHLWPFLQNLGQLTTLYGKDGAQTFFGNADAHIFFGLTDPDTLEHVSKRIGVATPDEIVTAPPIKQGFKRWDHAKFLESDQVARDRLQAEQENEQRMYQHKMGLAGQPRIPPEQVKSLISKPDDANVSNSMIVFGKGSNIFNLQLAPYFLKTHQIIINPTQENKESKGIVDAATNSIIPENMMVRFILSAFSGILIAYIATTIFPMMIDFIMNILRGRGIGEKNLDPLFWYIALFGFLVTLIDLWPKKK